MDERRQFVRVDCLVTGQVISINQIEDASSMLVTSAGLTQNVSAGGLLFRDSQKYELGKVMVIELEPGALEELDANIGEVIKTRGFVLGKIVRVDEVEKDSVYDYGVCFIKIDEEGDYMQLFQDLLNQIEFDPEE